MRRAIGLCVLALFLSGAAYGTTYTWTNAATSGAGRDWQTGSNWDLGKAPTTGDVAIVATGGKFSSTADISVGELRMAGTSDYSIGSYVITTRADNAASGNFWYRSTNLPDSSGTVKVYGNFLMDWSPTGSAWNGWPGVVQLYGTNTAFHDASLRNGDTIVVYGTGIWDNASYATNAGTGSVTVQPGGSIGGPVSPVTTSTWDSRRFTFGNGQASLPAPKSPVDFQYSPMTDKTDNGTYKLVVAGGVIYPRNVSFASAWDSSNPPLPHTWRVKGGDVTVTQDLIISHYSDQTAHHFSTIENGTANSVNLTVGRDVKVGTYNSPATRIDKIWFNNSTVRIGQDLLFGTGTNLPSGSGDLGGATIYLGRNLTIQDPQAVNPAYTGTLSNWSSGTSTLICDGNGTSATLGRKDQTLTTYSYRGFNLANLVIRNECATVSLANSRGGELLLTGNLRLEKGKFNDNDRAIFFNGPNHTLFWDNNLCKITGTTPNALDNVILLPGAVVFLDAGTFTKIKMDNIEMQSGSKLYLNGFTLIADGKSPWVSSEVSDQGVGYEQGTIYGTLVIPEPATLLFVGTGLLGALGWARRRRMK